MCAHSVNILWYGIVSISCGTQSQWCMLVSTNVTNAVRDFAYGPDNCNYYAKIPLAIIDKNCPWLTAMTNICASGATGPICQVHHDDELWWESFPQGRTYLCAKTHVHTHWSQQPDDVSFLLLRLEYSERNLSVPSLLVHWLRASPAHQQPWPLMMLAIALHPFWRAIDDCAINANDARRRWGQSDH